MSHQLRFWNLSILFVLVLLFTACEKELLNPQEEISNNTTLLSSKSTIVSNNSLPLPEIDAPQGFPILFGKTSVICVQAPCPCMPIFGYCDEEPWEPWHPTYRITDQYGGGYLSVVNEQLRLVFANEIEQALFPINNPHQLSAELSEALGYGQITLLPGEYPIDYSSSAAGEVYLDFSE